MTELKATGLVDMTDGGGQLPSKISLSPVFEWFITDEFKVLKDLCKEKYPPRALEIKVDSCNEESTNKTTIVNIHNKEKFDIYIGRDIPGHRTWKSIQS